MKWIKNWVVFESTDLNYGDRDFTNKYLTCKGWVRYTDAHKDSYIKIDKYFYITWDHLGWILEDLVNKCDLYYRCSVADSSGLQPGAEDYGKFGTPEDHINIDLIPAKFEELGGYEGVNFRTYMSKYTNYLNPKKNDTLIGLLKGIEDKLSENFPYLTIRNEYYPSPDEDLNKWNLFITSTQIKLYIKRV